MSDNALLERVLNGDETAFVEIVRRYNSTLVRRGAYLCRQ